MAQYISNLPAGSIVNLIENRSGTKYFTPFLIIATGNGNPYGSDKVLCVRYRYTDNMGWNSSGTPVYVNSIVDNWLTNTYLLRFDDATKNCIAMSTVFCNNIADGTDYTIARKAFLPSANEMGYSNSSDPSANPGYFVNNSMRIAFNDNGITADNYWLRVMSDLTHPYTINGSGSLSVWDNLPGNRHTRPALNLYASCKVSSQPNADGSYNLLPGVYASVGDNNTGVTDASVDPSVFLQMISGIGSYTFTYDGSDWIYDGNAVDLADYGITVTGTPVSGDTVVITNPQSQQIIDVRCRIAETDFMPTQCIVDWAEDNNGTTYLQLCNNYNDQQPTWENSAKNTLHNFTNTTKTANTWCVGARLYAQSENIIKIYAPHALIRKW